MTMDHDIMEDFHDVKLEESYFNWLLIDEMTHDDFIIFKSDSHKKSVTHDFMTAL